MAIRNRVRELRAIIGKGELSQKELAERAGIDPSTLSDIENNQTNASVETAIAIARALGVSLDDLFLPVRTDGLSVGIDHDDGESAPAAASGAPSTAVQAVEPPEVVDKSKVGTAGEAA